MKTKHKIPLSLTPKPQKVLGKLLLLPLLPLGLHRVGFEEAVPGQVYHAPLVLGKAGAVEGQTRQATNSPQMSPS
ncbi:hypothetical protein E2C01_030085 [Portunus trituberculatus]|uniref:Uncharacterized protein n=1 Tax=Portunus trituberculatus TaxID=210409 RepID=A0A5B7EPK2_PORTR|nr:hypothetical protein [Portunus trituberculatus]